MLKQKIKDDLNKALRKGDKTALSTLRLLSAAILNKEKEKRFKEGTEDLTDEEVLGVLASEAKKRKEASAEYQKGNRPDLAQKEKEELLVIQKYLPDQMSESELRQVILIVIKKTGSSNPKDMGKVMQDLTKEMKGRFDGAQASKIARELLASNDRN